MLGLPLWQSTHPLLSPRPVYVTSNHVSFVDPSAAQGMAANACGKIEQCYLAEYRPDWPWSSEEALCQKALSLYQDLLSLTFSGLSAIEIHGRFQVRTHYREPDLKDN